MPEKKIALTCDHTAISMWLLTNVSPLKALAVKLSWPSSRHLLVQPLPAQSTTDRIGDGIF